MNHWEYQTFDYFPSQVDLVAWLNILGSQSWELVCFKSTELGMGYSGIFKRPYQDSDEG